MDVLFPYLPRVTTTPVDSNNRLILPVSKYQRIHAEASTEQQYRVGMRDPRRHQQEPQQQQSSQHEQPGEHQQGPQQAGASTEGSELHLLPTGHAVTPEQDQHADAEGHLDIYI
ncbi:hypothetical protein [Rheinheimera sp. 4Y26]|uniref:hypothetical protein n=1 Tax=Rheinheimera sp. 4Y26 TaxID=2977811 RepID=UPI0021B0B8E3|nr:hypothetical protein [Rheinheimera sp. 4Y26]MCT6701453.1 hypothetical protein [Rheinheimera sp. 4Y26]